SAFFVCFLNHFVCARWHRGGCTPRGRARKCSGPPLRRSAGAIASPTTACLKATGSVYGPPCPAMYGVLLFLWLPPSGGRTLTAASRARGAYGPVRRESGE